MTKKIGKKRLFLIIAGACLLLAGIVGLLAAFLTKEKSFSLDEENFGLSEFVEISGEEYEKMLQERKSFLVFVDQDGCITADGLRKISKEISEEKNLKIYKIMFADARGTSMHDKVKFYPSFVIVNSGKIVSWLKADADEDIERFKNKTELSNWLNLYIKWNN